LISNGHSRPTGPPGGGPSVAAVALWGSSNGSRVHLLTDEERAQLAVISSVVRFKKGACIYQEGDRADAVFNIVSGVVKTYKILPDGTQHILAFLFADDLFGLAEEGRYVNSAEAVTAVTGYRIPARAIESRLRRDPGLEFHVICKLCHELREAQRHAVVLSKRRALAKVATFLQILDTHQAARGESTDEVYLPMSRSDFGHYVGMSLEAVSRSFRTLTNRGVITIRDRRHVKIVDRYQLENIASDVETRTSPSTAVYEAQG
jgi:CRP-like cAMP-binding protein